MTTDPIGVYVHIPFCLRKCLYCDFCSYADLPSATRTAYIDRLVEEIRSVRADRRGVLDTVYFGGGTPSLLTPTEFSRIVNALHESFDWAEDTEFSIEANPRTLTESNAICYRALGVNRISIGLQSIHENEQKILGRIHNFEDFCQCYDIASRVGIDNINVDLMYAFPSQTPRSFEQTLRRVLEFSPAHISAYGLIVEDGTPFGTHRASLKLPSEETELSMYETLCGVLRENGYLHYEISNFARPDRGCRHNLKYWRAEPYRGFGVSAYSYDGRRRFGNARDLQAYLAASPPPTASVQTDEEARFEYGMLRLRLSEGISLSAYRDRFGVDFIQGRERVIQNLVDGGFLTVSEDRISLTERGFYVSNAVMTEIL